MGKPEKVLQQVLLGRSDANLAFADLTQLLFALGFAQRIRGDHHIFTRGTASPRSSMFSQSVRKPRRIRCARFVPSY
jgi:hypothetical protein